MLNYAKVFFIYSNSGERNQNDPTTRKLEVKYHKNIVHRGNI